MLYPCKFGPNPTGYSLKQLYVPLTFNGGGGGGGGGGTLYIYDIFVWMIYSELIRIHMVCLEIVTVYRLINKDISTA